MLFVDPLRHPFYLNRLLTTQIVIARGAISPKFVEGRRLPKPITYPLKRKHGMADIPNVVNYNKRTRDH